MRIHLRLARPIEDPQKKNAHNLFLQKIKTNGDICGVCLSERATKLKSAKFPEVQNFLLIVSFPGGYFVFADTKVVGRHLLEG